VPTSTPKATALAKQAEKAYKANQYQEAAELLGRAWDAAPVPKYLYNLARAHDQAGALEAAMQAYRRYVSLPPEDIEPELVRKSNLAMDRLRSLLTQKEADQKAQEAARQKLEVEARVARLRADEEARKAQQQRAEYEAKERAAREAAGHKASTRKVAAFAVGGAALAGLGVWGGFGIAATGSKAAFEQATTLADKRRLEATTRTQALVADVGLAVGLVGAVTAVLLYPKGVAGPPAPTAMTVSLVPAAGGAWAAIGGTFP
jgi:tetratricopeptide (TPR) repeat protein